mmetsp:Transcript_31937/g.63258  ORF Transcript_31937/g.63258 Transcript_31937/m.63258 type:complete len:177 (+) Transcript_31937:180-710(+)|eukprot:CAMPEP_0194305962 /NCGR_PEP_ID=MMETSP0171-20130528/3262_1 /TAXON_ID=218684 /ORGANISM="Corethron pennatum, Strain L29A3" /LENGTH=176 /DNA_ID=CAMNT_0039057631 /DNA_START=81 /DNA_END=611 /DNA_ORIENTATION=-
MKSQNSPIRRGHSLSLLLLGLVVLLCSSTFVFSEEVSELADVDNSESPAVEVPVIEDPKEIVPPAETVEEIVEEIVEEVVEEVVEAVAEEPAVEIVAEIVEEAVEEPPEAPAATEEDVGESSANNVSFLQTSCATMKDKLTSVTPAQWSKIAGGGLGAWGLGLGAGWVANRNHQDA